MKYREFNRLYLKLRALHIPRRVAYRLTVLVVL